MAIVKITNHSEQAVDRLAHQFKGKARIEGLIQAFIDQYQLTEDMFFDLLNFRSIDTAQGAQLDILGSIVGEARGGREDEPYRKAIYARIGINTSKGTPENAIQIFKFITESERVHLLEMFPGELELYADNNIEYVLAGDDEDAFAFDGGIDGLGFGDIFDSDVGGMFAYLVTNDINGIYILMEKIIPAGVRLNYIGWFDGDDAFSFETDSEGLGFGDLSDSAIGGNFAKIVPHQMFFSFYSESERTRGFGNTVDMLIGGNFNEL